MDYERLGLFYLGREHASGPAGAPRAPILYDARDLTTHAVCVGMTGSGKTGLCVGLLEEAAIDGVPAIVIDPKGDLGSLALTFPALLGALFGRKVGTVGTVGRASTAARAASRTARERDEVGHARARLDRAHRRLAELDAELQDRLASVAIPDAPADYKLTALEVPPRRGDVTVERIALAWCPV